MKRLLLLIACMPLLVVIQTALGNEIEKITLFCKNTELTGPNFSNGPQEWNNFLVDIYPSTIVVTESVYFDGSYEISSKVASKLIVVASKGQNLINLDRFSGKFWLSQSLNSTKLKYSLNSECGLHKPLF